MNPLSIAVGYVSWHYGRAFKDILIVWTNLLWFITHFFSIPLLLRTLFSPWKRIQETYQRNGMEDYFATIVVNIMTRIVGAFVRLWIILFGLLALISAGVGVIGFYIFWVFTPVLLPLMFCWGLIMLFF